MLEASRGPVYSAHGARMGRDNSRDAFAPFTINPFFGSQVIFRSVRIAISHRWLIMSDRTASSIGLTVVLRDLTASMKFWSCLGLSSK